MKPRHKIQLFVLAILLLWLAVSAAVGYGQNEHHAYLPVITNQPHIQILPGQCWIDEETGREYCN